MKIENQDFYYFLTSSKYITNIWDKVFKNGPSKICGRQPLKILLGLLLNTFSRIFCWKYKFW